MARFLITTLLLFNLLIVPSCAQEPETMIVDDDAQQQPQPVDDVLQRLADVIFGHVDGAQQELQQRQLVDDAEQQPQPQPVVEQDDAAQQQPQPVAGAEKQPQPVDGTRQQPQPIAGAEKQPQPVDGTQQQPQPIAGAEQQPQPVDGAQQQQPQQVDEQPTKKVKKIHRLKEGFYNISCPDAEKIVAEHINALFLNDPMVVASFIRLLFHDCFVNGCDASLLLDSTDNGDKVEKGSRNNGELLKGVEHIDDIKEKLEERCPGRVSCSDILSFSAMEAMALAGIPRRPYLGGRRDGMISLASQVDIDQNLPLPDWTMDQIIELYGRKGFTIEDLVVLGGAHSIGRAHCSVFKNRIVGYGGAADGADPGMPKQLASELDKLCKPPGTTEARANPTVNFDETPTILDNLFFKNLVGKKKALLASDQNLLNDPRTSPFVHQFAEDQVLFQNKFADAMVRLSSIDVLLGRKRGEIRKTCRSTN